MTEYPKWDYQEYPKTLPRDDLWGQVRRTIYGRRPSEAEISKIVAHVRDGLGLRATDTLLDLGCGNGALSARLFPSSGRLVGVDLSPYLIEIAKENFERPPVHVFFNDDVAHFVQTCEDADSFTKVMSYAAFQYLDVDAVPEVLEGLHTRFPHVEKVFVGNLPDEEKADLFFKEGHDSADLTNPRSQIGRWWTRDAVTSLARSCGWKARFSQLPPEVFNAAYRFDALLTRT